MQKLDDNKTHTNRFEIRSASSNRVYVVAKNRANGRWECSCPGWVLKAAKDATGTRERRCKHITALHDTFKKASSAEKLFMNYKTYEGAAGTPTDWTEQASKVLEKDLQKAEKKSKTTIESITGVGRRKLT